MLLRQLRTLKGVTQKEVGKALGCSEVAYNRYENGEREPSLEMVVKIADYFGVTVDYLLEHESHLLPVLSDYEKSLVLASRNADERAREDALQVLLAHQEKGAKRKTSA